MHRVIASLRLLGPRIFDPGPMEPSSDGKVDPRHVGEFLDAVYIAVEKMRAFGLKDEHIGGKLKIVERKPGEKANGRYFPKKDEAVIYHPPIHGPADLPWTIIHETMHRVWVKHIPKEGKQLWELLCDSTGKECDEVATDAMVAAVQSKPERNSLWHYFRKHFGQDLSLFKHWLSTKRLSDSFPSKYASADPAEAFSEVAANVILGRGHAGRELLRTGSIVRKIFLCVIDTVREKRAKWSLDESIGGVLYEDLQLEQQDEYFLQTQVDFGYLRASLPQWVSRNVHQDEILKLETRPHVTVYYGADKRDLPLIKEIVEDYGRSIRLMMGNLNIFEHPDQDVLYVEMIGDSVRELHDKIAKLPHTRPPTHPEYHPHMTLAYLKKGAGRRYVGMSPFHSVVSARGLTISDANRIETYIRSVPLPQLEREPLLMAGR